MLLVVRYTVALVALPRRPNIVAVVGAVIGLLITICTDICSTCEVGGREVLRAVSARRIRKVGGIAVGTFVAVAAIRAKHRHRVGLQRISHTDVGHLVENPKVVALSEVGGIGCREIAVGRMLTSVLTLSLTAILDECAGAVYLHTLAVVRLVLHTIGRGIDDSACIVVGCHVLRPEVLALLNGRRCRAP